MQRPSPATGSAPGDEEIHDPEDRPEPAPRKAAPRGRKTSSRASRDKPDTLKASLSGYAWSELDIDTRLDNGREDAAEWKNHLFLRLSVSPNARLRAVASLRVRYTWAGQRNESNLPFVVFNAQAGRQWFEPTPGETFLELLPMRGLSVRVGLQNFQWGQSDGWSPADPLNPRDLRWGLAMEPNEVKIPVFAVALGYAWDQLQVTAAWVPFFVPMRGWLFQHDLSLFSPGGSVLPVDLGSLLPREMVTSLQQAILPGYGPTAPLDGSAFALRLSGFRGGVEFALGYYHGPEKFPRVRLDPELGRLLVQAASPNPPLLTISNLAQTLLPRLRAGEVLASGDYPQNNQFFGEVAGALGPFVLRLDIGATLAQTIYALGTEDPLYPLRRTSFTAVAGVDYRYGEKLIVSLQWLYHQMFGVEDNATLLLLSPRFQALSWLVRWTLLHGKLELAIAGIAGISQGDVIVVPRVGYLFAGRFHVSIGMVLFEGSEKGFGGFFGNNDYAFVRLRLGF